MTIKFNPDGFLDIASDPSDLPSEVMGKDEKSGAMRRCTNLQLDKSGIASTRHGSSKVNSSALDQLTAYNIIELGGIRYVFAGSKIYQDETEIEDELFGTKWGGIKYNPYNSDSVSVFALNGTERKRIDGADVYEWGMDAPTTVPAILAQTPTGLSGDYNAKYTHARKEGALLISESNPSDAAAAAVTLTTQSLRVICPHDFSDIQQTHLRVYRTMTGGSVYFYDQEIPLADYASYAYTYEWEEEGAYLSGDGYELTERVEATFATKQLYYEDGTGIHQFGKRTGNRIICQSVLATADFTAGAASIELRKVGNPGDITVALYSNQTPGYNPGTLLTSATLKASEVSTVVGWKDLFFTDSTAITTGSLYWLVISVAKAQLNHYYRVKGYWNEDGTSQFGSAYECIKMGNSLDDLDFYLPCDMNFKISTATETWNKAVFSWEEDDSVETDSPAGKGCHYWEPGILLSNTADTALGTEVATNHNRPPLGTFVFGPSYNGTCFILIDNKLYYCLPKQPEYWPLTYFLEVCSGHMPAIAGTIYEGQVYVSSEVQIYNIPGTGHTSFGGPVSMSAITGTISAQCFLAIRGYGLFHLGNDGLYLHSGNKDENITNARFKPLFDGDTVGSIPGIDQTNIANCWLVPYKSKLYFAYPESGSTYPDNLIITDLRTGKSVHFDYNGAAFPCAVVDEENDRLLAMDTAGYIWELEDPDETDDDGTAISWQIETKEHTDQLRKYFPRYARYDVTLNDGATATGYVLLDGTSQQSHSISTSRSIKKRLVDGGNGDRLALRITGTGPVDIFGAEIE